MRGPGSSVGQSVSMWTLSSGCPHSYMWRLGAHCDAAYRARGQSCKRSGTLSLISLRRGGNLLGEWQRLLFVIARK